MIYVKNNSRIEGELVINVEGIDITLTENQMIQLGYIDENEYIRNVNKELDLTSPISDMKTNIIDELELSLPSDAGINGEMITLPFKLGYKWEPIIENGKITYVSVEDPTAFGTRSNPILYSVSIILMPNAYYIYNNELYVYVGKKLYVTNYGDGTKDLIPWHEIIPEIEELGEGDNENIKTDIKSSPNTEDTPYEFANSMTVYPNYYYSHENKIYVYMGRTSKIALNWEEVVDDMVEW